MNKVDWQDLYDKIRDVSDNFSLNQIRNFCNETKGKKGILMFKDSKFIFVPDKDNRPEGDD